MYLTCLVNHRLFGGVWLRCTLRNAVRGPLAHRISAKEPQVRLRKGSRLQRYLTCLVSYQWLGGVQFYRNMLPSGKHVLRPTKINEFRQKNFKRESREVWSFQLYITWPLSTRWLGRVRFRVNVMHPYWISESGQQKPGASPANSHYSNGALLALWALDGSEEFYFVGIRCILKKQALIPTKSTNIAKEPQVRLPRTLMIQTVP